MKNVAAIFFQQLLVQEQRSSRHQCGQDVLETTNKYLLKIDMNGYQSIVLQNKILVFLKKIEISDGKWMLCDQLIVQFMLPRAHRELHH